MQLLLLQSSHTYTYTPHLHRPQLRLLSPTLGLGEALYEVSVANGGPDPNPIPGNSGNAGNSGSAPYQGPQPQKTAGYVEGNSWNISDPSLVDRRYVGYCIQEVRRKHTSAVVHYVLIVAVRACVRECVCVCVCVL